MKKKILTTALLAAGMLSLSGCVERKIVVRQTQEETPDFAIKEDIVIDWDEVRNECEAVLISDDFPHVEYIDFAVYEEDKIIRLILPLDEVITQIESLDYGTAYIKMFNDIVATQDFSYAKSGEDYYGGLWDEYNLILEVFKEEELVFPELYYINQDIPAGTHLPVEPQIRQIQAPGD